MRNPFEFVKAFEAALCEYTGSNYAVAVNSCTMALLLAAKYHALQRGGNPVVEIPNRTYVSVPMSIVHAGCKVAFRDCEWLGFYQLKPFPVYDSARFFTGNMYREHFQPGDLVCLSFHNTKVLGDTQGGAILCDNYQTYEWLKRMRFDGRTEGKAPKDDQFTEIGYHCYMSPDVAARLLWRLQTLPYDNAPLPNDDYPNLSQLDIFK